MNRILAVLVLLVSINLVQAQPYAITAYIDSTVIKNTDYSTLQNVSYSGQGLRWMFDRRINDWEYLSAYLFNAVFDDGITTEVQVNPEFGSVVNATLEANKYAFILGQLPVCLRTEIHKVWIHQGTESFGGGFNALLIHVGMSSTYENLGILEEVLFHEATHSSLDPIHANASGWIAAQNLDAGFISNYAASNSTVEDIAESFLTWLMVRQCNRRISITDSLTISQTIPNRLNYFDNQNFAMYPICIDTNPLSVVEILKDSFDVYPNPTNGKVILEVLSAYIDKPYSIYDQLGRNVIVGTIESTMSTIDISILPAGIYILNIGQEMKQSVKIIKQ